MLSNVFIDTTDFIFLIICTWNVRSLYRAGSLKTDSRELARHNLDSVGVQEVRWEGSGTKPAGEYIFF
jgi:hypothetical protein